MQNKADKTTIIAMWSGPRNLSTAMMRSFGQRADCLAMDEPFYAAYLASTGLPHPMAEEVIASGEIDPDKVVALCTAPPKPPATVCYQKHMTHHMIDGFDISWISQVTNVFLIRDPARVLASYAAKSEHVTPEDIGFRMQQELFDLAHKDGEIPVVVDAQDIRANPAEMLKKLCAAVDLDFDPVMLSWPAGPRPEDGIWSKHWYDAVWKSTGFAPPETKEPPVLSGSLKEIEQEVRGHYDYMRKFRITL